MHLLYILLFTLTFTATIPPILVLTYILVSYCYKKHRQRSEKTRDLESGLVGHEGGIALLERGDLGGFIIRLILEGADDF